MSPVTWVATEIVSSAWDCRTVLPFCWPCFCYCFGKWPLGLAVVLVISVHVSALVVCSLGTESIQQNFFCLVFDYKVWWKFDSGCGTVFRPEFSDLSRPVSASWVLRLQTCASTHASLLFILSFCTEFYRMCVLREGRIEISWLFC